MATKTKTRGPAPYKGPYGTPMAHVQYQQARHLQPERLPFRRHEVPTTLRLLDVSKESLENLRKVAATIKRLLAPSLKLQTVPEPLVAFLERLERLDLGHNRLTDASFPDCMKSLESLVELRLNHNQLTRLPACLRRLRNLSRLDLSNNHLETAAGVEKLKNMQFLVLDNNKVSSIFKEISPLRKLEMLRCSSNHLRDVPREVRNLRQLRDLDISNNRIALLPTDVFQLPRLECLNASQNQVTKVPTFNVKVQSRHWVASVDLSENNVVKFPAHLMRLARRLDLGGNKIKTISWAALRKLDPEGAQELLLDRNPLTYPPPEVCESGLKSIVQFFQESQADVKAYQGVKVMVVGSRGSGKTSLIHSLVDQQSRLTDDAADSAPGVDAYEMSFDYDVENGKPGKSLNLCLWDFCGDPFYLYPHYIFHEQPSITVLTFSLPEYSPDNFAEQIGSWFDWMIAKTNKLVVLLVGTKSDGVTSKKAAEISRDIREKLAAHLQKRQTMIERRIKEIEQRPVISPTLSEQLKTYMRLLQAKFTVQTEVIPTSCKTFQGFDKLKDALECLSNDRKLFPNVMRVIPTFWVEVENWAEERGNALIVPVMPWEEFSDSVTQRFGMKHLLVSITQYLHETGKVFWFSNVPSLKGLVFLRPSWLFHVLKDVFRHDLETVAFTPDETLKAIAFTPAKFERLKQELLAEGVLDRELLKALLVAVIPADLSKPSWEVLQMLTQNLEMGYPVAKRPKDRHYTFGIERDTDGKLMIPKLLIPWFRRSAEPMSFRETWASLEDRRHIAALYKFPCYMPPGLFEILTVRAYAEKHKLVFLSHWGGGVHARHVEEKVHLLIVYYRENSQGQQTTNEDLEEVEAAEVGKEAKNDTAEEDTGNRKGKAAVQNGVVASKVPDKQIRRFSPKRGEPASFAKEVTDSTKKLQQSPLRKGDLRKNSDNPSGGDRNARKKPTIPLVRSDSTDSLDSVRSDDSDSSAASTPSTPSSASRRRQLLDADPERPETIEEMEEVDVLDDYDYDVDDDVDILNTSGAAPEVDCKGSSREKTNSNSARGRTQGRVNSVGSNKSADNERGINLVPAAKEVQTRPVKERGLKPKSSRPTANNCSDEDYIVLKVEVRDNSEDTQDQTPASTMWNILLPILMDFEDLLQGYAGVLVERRTKCPFCGEASFLGEWLTPKETQGLNTRTCDACSQAVDTAFLVQPREKKRVVITRNRFRHRRSSDLPEENGEAADVTMTSCASSSGAASNDAAPP